VSTGTAARRTSPSPPSPSRRTAVVTAVLHLLALWPYALSNLVVAGAGYLAMLVLWAGFAVAAVVVHRRWGGLSALVPLVAVLTWFAVLTLGESLLGWSA
jgi:hypothetical protein